MPLSGNCYKAAWILHRLGIPFDMIRVNSLDGETRSPDFSKKSPNGQVPLLELDDGRRVAESNAIMLFLEETFRPAETSAVASFIPTDAYQRALMYQWMFFEQYTHEPSIAVRRGNVIFQRPCTKEEMDQLLKKGNAALGVMEQQLATTPYMVGEAMTLADVTLFAYTHVAHEGEYDLSQFPNIQKWLERVQASPGYCRMDILERHKA